MTDEDYLDLRDLRARLVAQPRSKPTAGTASIAYGYVRTAVPDPAYGDACTALLSEWCQREGWQLGGVFRDVGVCGLRLDRPGFTGLLDALRLANSAAVLVLAARHLSHSDRVAEQLTSQIRRTGAVLRVLADEVNA